MMKYFFIITMFITGIVSAKDKIYLSNDVYENVPFSSQFFESGALIRNINFDAVNKLIPQLEKKYKLKLQDRGESHITVITPPEAKGWSAKDPQGINALISSSEIHQKYFSTLQKTSFKIKCIGARKNKKNHVFYLVVESDDLLSVRNDISTELSRRAKFANTRISFNPKKYWPHITIGFSGGDVHGVSKGQETCLKDIELVIK